MKYAGIIYDDTAAAPGLSLSFYTQGCPIHCPGCHNQDMWDFEGGYENDTKGGMLHVASHHFSPGKKQWTWGNGDFGRAWDRCLTDDDYEGAPGVFRPYIELMAGVYTENQPDFTWLQPYEEKTFVDWTEEKPERLARTPRVISSRRGLKTIFRRI